MKRRETILRAMQSWRDQYNPLRGLDIGRAVSLLEAGMRGEYAELQWTYEFIEQSDPDLVALVERRLSAISELDWNVNLRDEDSRGFDQTLAEDQAEALREAYERLDNLQEAIDHLSLASFRGFSILQPHRDAGGGVKRLECLDHWNFVRNGRNGGWGWNPQAKPIGYRSILEADRLDAAEFIIREVRRPIDRLGLVKFVRASLSERDWDDFIEAFGVPSIFIVMPENVPEDKREEYRLEAESAGDGGGGSLPFGSDVKTAPVDRGVAPFALRLDYLTKKLILAGTGGMLTMLTESGSGTLAGGAHEDTFRTIARAEAKRISELLQRKFDAAVLDAVFPGRPRLAYWELAANESVDVTEMVGHWSTLALAGLRVDAQEASEKTGYKLTAVDLPAAFEPTAMGRALNRSTPAEAAGDQAQEQLAAVARQELAEAIGADLAPLRKRIEAALALDDEAMMASLQALIDELPTMLEHISAAPAAQAVIERIMAAAMMNGLEEGQRT